MAGRTNKVLSGWSGNRPHHFGASTQRWSTRCVDDNCAPRLHTVGGSPGSIRCADLAGSHGEAGHQGSVAFRRETCYSSAPACIKHFVMGFVYHDPMEGTSEGLADRLYWRRARGEWHSFKRLDNARGYTSLCQCQEIAIVRGLTCAAACVMGWDCCPASPLVRGMCEMNERLT
jgi:hypothetical protein